MTTLQLFGYLSDVWVLVTYFVLAHSGKHATAFHWANALGAAPLLVAEYQLGAWQVLPLTGTFCLIGWVGVVKAWHAKVRALPFEVEDECTGERRVWARLYEEDNRGA